MESAVVHFGPGREQGERGFWASGARSEGQGGEMRVTTIIGDGGWMRLMTSKGGSGGDSLDHCDPCDQPRSRVTKLAAHQKDFARIWPTLSRTAMKEQ